MTDRFCEVMHTINLEARRGAIKTKQSAVHRRDELITMVKAGTAEVANMKHGCYPKHIKSNESGIDYHDF